MAYESSLSPSYYKRGASPVWDFIRDQGLNFHLGNAIKYICRAGYKDGKAAEDLEKAIVYLQNELTNVKRKDLPKHNSSDSIIFTGSRVSGSLSDYEFKFPSITGQTTDFDSGGVQGVFGSGGDVISF